MSIGTGGTGGIYYPFGGALASMLSERLPDHQFTAEVTAASVENVARLRQQQIDLGMSISLTVLDAYEGSGDDPPFRDLRLVAPLWPNPVNLLVPRGSEAKTLADLRGKRVAVGAPGSGTEQVSRALLAAYGMTYDDVNERFLSFSEASSALKDAAVDGAILEVAYPASAVLKATTTGGARLLPLEGPEIDSLLVSHPFFFHTVIPAGVYKGVDEDVPTFAETNWVIAREDLDSAVVTAVLDIIHDRRADLEQVNDIVRQVDLRRLEDAPLPLHPAARRWAEEKLDGFESAGRESGR